MSWVLSNHTFDKLDHKKIKKYIYLSYLQIFISTESMCHARSTSNIKKYNTKKSKKNTKNQKNQKKHKKTKKKPKIQKIQKNPKHPKNPKNPKNPI